MISRLWSSEQQTVRNPDGLDPALRCAGCFDHEIGMMVPDDETRARCVSNTFFSSRNSPKLLLDGRFDFNALAKATPGYVGADLSALAGAAGIVADKRSFKSFSDSTIVIPNISAASTIDADTATMQIDASYSVPVAPISSPPTPTPTPDARPGELVVSSLSITNLPIAHFLHSHPAPLTLT